MNTPLPPHMCEEDCTVHTKVGKSSHHRLQRHWSNTVLAHQSQCGQWRFSWWLCCQSTDSNDSSQRLAIGDSHSLSCMYVRRMCVETDLQQVSRLGKTFQTDTSMYLSLSNQPDTRQPGCLKSRLVSGWMETKGRAPRQPAGFAT